MKVLVTGAGGFIGFNLCLLLLKKGHDVVASYRSNIPEDVNLYLQKYRSQLTLSKGDLMDEDYVRSLDLQKIDAVVNAAVITSLDVSEKESFIYMAKTNIQTTINLLDFSIRNSINRHIYVSSSGVYGSKCEINETVKEDGDLSLFNTYAIAKRTSELLVSEYGKLTNGLGMSARIAAPYGPYERITTSRKAMSPIYMMIEAALDKKPLKIYGEKVVRDWTYVEDTVDGIYRLLISENNRFSEYNVSNSVSYCLGDIAEAVKKSMPEFEYSFTKNIDEADIAMKEGSQRGALDIVRIVEDTGFNPIFTLEKGIEKYSEWAKIGFTK